MEASYHRGVRGPRQAPAPTLGVLLIGLAAVSWGTTGSVMTVLGRRVAASPLLVGTARLSIAAALLALIAILVARGAQGRLSQVAHGSPQVGRPRRDDLWRALAAGACMAGYQAAYFTAVTLAGIAVTALVAICSAPLIIAALAPWLLDEHLTTRARVALGVGVMGTSLLVAAPGHVTDAPARFLAGGLLALAAGLAYALFVLTAKAGLARTAPLPLTALTFASGAVLLTPALLWADAPTWQLALGWPWLLYLGGVATAGAYGAYTVGLRRVPASVAGIVTLLEPLTATILGVMLFGERLGALAVGGAALLVGALGLLLSDGEAR